MGVLLASLLTKVYFKGSNLKIIVPAMLNTTKHAFHQEGHFLDALIKTMCLCKPTSDYHLNPEVALALYLGKRRHKILL